MAIAGLSLRVLAAGLLGKVTDHLSRKFFYVCNDFNCLTYLESLSSWLILLQ